MTPIFPLFILVALFTACSTPPQYSGPQYRGDVDFHPRSQNPAYPNQGPVICFDVAHNNLAVKKGFYQPVLELLTSDGYQVVHLEEPFAKSTLAACNVLYVSAVLSHADYETSKRQADQSAFKDSEIKSIVNWVNAGGSLLLMTDHKPMGSAAAKLLKQFGVSGSDVHVTDANHPIPPFKDEGIFKVTELNMNLQSQIVLGRNEDERLKEIYFFYGQALKGPKNADVFLRVAESAKIEGKQNEHFPAIALTLKQGKGRVAVFGDATVFTSKMDLYLNEPTGINRPGSSNIQMALNVFHWLSGLPPK